MSIANIEIPTVRTSAGDGNPGNPMLAILAMLAMN
jgi:hypothetical protein